MGLFREHADVSVRPATTDDEAAITRVQLRAWRASHTDVLGAETLENLDVAAVRDQWAAAINAPPSPAYRVLVACDGPRVVGFAASAPVDSAISLRSASTDAGSLTMARRTSRALTLPLPSQMPFSGASR